MDTRTSDLGNTSHMTSPPSSSAVFRRDAVQNRRQRALKIAQKRSVSKSPTGGSPDSSSVSTLALIRGPSSPPRIPQRGGRPPRMSPPTLATSRSWEDEGWPRPKAQSSGFGTSPFDERSVVSDSNIDAVPMDDEEEARAFGGNPVSGIDWARRWVPDSDEVSSLGGVEDSIQKITSALESGGTPSHMSNEEAALWEAVQEKIARSDPSLDTDYYEEEYRNKKAELESQRKEHEQAMRAIQRVLVDVTTQRDDAWEALYDKSGEADNSNWLRERANFQKDLETKSRKIATLERQLQIARSSKTRAAARDRSDSSTLKQEVDKRLEDMQKDLDLLRDENSALKSGNAARSSDAGLTEAALKSELAEKAAQLDSVKLIMSSLERANSDMAIDHRQKLKAKDDLIAQTKVDLADRQKRLDHLARELKDLQSLYARQEDDNMSERARRKGLTMDLERNLGDIRAATVVLEAGQDPEAMHRISEILVDAIETLKAGIEEECDDTPDAKSVGSNRSLSSSAAARLESKETLRKELEEKSATMKNIEEELGRQRAENLQLRADSEQRQRERDAEMINMQSELNHLREQCQTNMEVLTRKERELAVLRDSLKVDDGEVGYISDDNSDYDEEEEVMLAAPAALAYGPSQAEALATLSTYGSGSFDAGATFAASSNEIVMLRKELLKSKSEQDASLQELEAEKESLANAKMIISSLEKANKSMMEDLRSRLQDSNTAIASLLEKSMESDRTTSKLRSELEKVRRERKQDQNRYDQEIRRLQTRGNGFFSSIPTERID